MVKRPSRFRSIVPILLLGSLVASAEKPASLAQSRPTATASGRVIDGVTNQPIAGAFVTIGPAARTTGQPTIVADDQGRFMFRDLAPGAFELSAAARGYLGYLGDDGRVWNGVLAAPTTFIELSEAEQRSGITIRLWPPARISGTIRDDLGEPVEGVQPILLRVEYIAGHRRLRVAGGALTDDRGLFRSVRLVPGSYVVGVPMRRMTIPVSFRELLDRLTAGPVADQAPFERSIRSSGAMADFRAAGYRVGDAILEPGFGGASLGPAPTADGTVLSASTVFYPGVSNPQQAQAITIGPGEELRGIDIQVRLAKSNRVSGRVIGPDGPIGTIGLVLVPDGLDALAADYPFEQSVTVTSQSGEFTFAGVPRGSYLAKAYVIPPPPQQGQPANASNADDPTLSGSVAVVVGETDIAGVVLTLRKGPFVQGRLIFEGPKPSPTAQQMQQGIIRFEPADGRTASPSLPQVRTTIDSTGAFRSLGLPAGSYVVRATGFAGWILESATLNGRDVSDVPLNTADAIGDFTGLVVTLTDTPATVTGAVRTAAGSAATLANVLLFSTNPAYWTDRGASPRRMLRGWTSKDGAFSFSGMPAGDYFALATTDALPENWSMPEFLKSVSGLATSVTVEKRTARTVTLTATTLPRGGGR